MIFPDTDKESLKIYPSPEKKNIIFEFEIDDFVRNMNTVRVVTLERAKIIGQCILDMVEECEKAQDVE